MDGLADALPRPAAADVAGEGLVDVAVARPRLRGKERGRLEDHPRLAVAALRHVLLEPGELAGVAAVAGEALDRRVGVVRRARDRHLAGAHALSVLEDGAGSADADSAAELRPGQQQPVAKDPEQRSVRLGVHLAPAAVDGQTVSRHVPSPVRSTGALRGRSRGFAEVLARSERVSCTIQSEPDVSDLSVFLHLTLDGFYAGPSGEIEWFKVIRKDAEYDDFTHGQSQAGGTLIFGRTTYQMMKTWWPTPAAIAADRPEDGCRRK